LKAKNSQVLIIISMIALVQGLFFLMPTKALAAFNSSSIIPDAQFSASGTMTQQQIQDFLVAKGGSLASYTVPTAYNATTSQDGTKQMYVNTYIGPIGSEVNVAGWSASKVIYQASQWYGINPQVILATLQKEQSLVTDRTTPVAPLTSYANYLNNWGFEWSMGYAYTDSGIKSACSTSTNHNPTGSCMGFAMQVDWGAGALSYAQAMANSGDSTSQSKVSPYITGHTILIDGVSTYLCNGATASLYRYTPHFSGNQNFYSIYNLWFVPYDYQVVSSINPPTRMLAGTTAAARLVIKNTGTATWQGEGSTNPVRLAILNADGRNFYTKDGSWLLPYRITMSNTSVAPGQNATFNFTVTAPLTLGLHVMTFVPVLEGVQQFKDTGMYFLTTVYLR
jgi:hypothetical protein